jgi:hypothetical protein
MDGVAYERVGGGCPTPAPRAYRLHVLGTLPYARFCGGETRLDGVWWAPVDTRAPVANKPAGWRVRVSSGTGAGQPQNTLGLPVPFPNYASPPS